MPRCRPHNGASYEIKTTTEPYALRLTTDSVAHIFVAVVDKEGNVVKQADNEVTLRIRGARLLGLENGNIMDTTINGRRQQNRLRVLNGQLVGYFANEQQKGEITITATSPFLQSAEIRF